MAPSTDAAAQPSVGLSLRTKALGVFLLVSLAPVAVVLGFTLRDYGSAVRTNEERMQLLVVRDVAADAERHFDEVRSDVRAVAGVVAIAKESAATDDAVVAAVRAVLASRPALAGVRLEIPEGAVSLPFIKQGQDADALPRSTPELRAEADARGFAVGVDARRATVVVPVPGPKGGANAAYVVAPLWLDPLESDLARAIERNGASDPETRAVIVDRGRRVLARLPADDGLARGADARALPIWSLLGGESAGLGDQEIGAAGVYLDGDVARFGTVHGTGELGWAVAISRPEAVALSAYHHLRAIAFWLGSGVVALAIFAGIVASRAITGPVLAVAARARLIGARRYRGLAPLPARTDELGALTRAIDTMAVDLETSEASLAKEAQLRTDLSRFLGAELVDAIVRGEHSLELGGERRVVTVLFADVVAFTPIAERGKPEVVVAMLNELFSILSEVVFRHGGTVDKFIGDSIMAVFGAPIAKADHAERALAAAEDMIRFTETAAEDWTARFGVDVRIAIGVNSGEVVVGNIGSQKRMEYTVIGDAVNVAARLEALAAKNQVLVGASTAELVGDRVPLQRVGERKLLGRSDATVVYELAS